MKFEIIDSTAMKITHPHEESIVASVREFCKTRLLNNLATYPDPFKEINSYMEKKLNKKQQQEVFDAYKTMFSELSVGNYDIEIVKKVLNENFIKIYDIIQVQDVHDYMDEHNMFNIPDDITDGYTGEYSQLRTYIRPKYKGLIALAMCAHLAIPVWGEFTPTRKNAIGSKRVPIPLIQMLENTNILDSSQFKDLEQYVNATIDAGKFEAGRIVAGYGGEYNRQLNLASNFVKKVAVTINSKDIPLAKDIFSYIAKGGAYNDASSGDVVWLKKNPAQEEEKSRWGKYDILEQISQGDICMNEHYFSRPDLAVRHYLHFETEEIVKEYVSKANRIADHLESKNFEPKGINLRIPQWLLSRVVPPKILTYIDFYYRNQALGATVALLLYLGYHDLIPIVVGEEVVSSDGFVVRFKSNRKTMPEDIEERLNEHYPLMNKTKDREGGNVAKQAINNFYTEVNNKVIKLCAPESMVEQLQREGILNKHARYSVNPDTPIRLAKLLLSIIDLQNI